MKRANYSKHTLRKQDCIYALSFTGVLRDRVFCKELCWFLRCRAGKKKKEKKKDFVQPLVAFPSCNISYFGCTHCVPTVHLIIFLPIRPKKKGKICLKNAIFRKWAMWNTGLLYSVFGPLLVVCLFVVLPLCSQVFSHFFLATRKKQKQKAKIGLGTKGYVAKIVHMLMQVGLWDKLFFLALANIYCILFRKQFKIIGPGWCQFCQNHDYILSFT